jgi:hypothetical protein
MLQDDQPTNPVASGQSDQIVWIGRWRFETLRMVLAVIVVVVTTAIAVEPLPKWEVRAVNDLQRFAEWPMRACSRPGCCLLFPLGLQSFGLSSVTGGLPLRSCLAGSSLDGSLHGSSGRMLIVAGLVRCWTTFRLDGGRPAAATRSSTPIDDNRVSAAASRPIGRTPLQRDTHKVAEDRPQTEQKSAVDGDGISSRASRTRISAGVPDQSRCLRSIRGDRCVAGGRVPANRAGSATRT